MSEKTAEYSGLQESFPKWKPGEVILKYDGKVSNWHSHPQGVIIEEINKNEDGLKEGKLLLNGKDILYEGKWMDILSHPKGVLIDDRSKYRGFINSENEGRLLLNGKEIYKGEYHSFKICPQGVIIEKDKKFFLNGKNLLYDRSKEDYVDWFVHKDGIIIEKAEVKGDSVESKLLLNGEKIFYKCKQNITPLKEEEYKFSPHPLGVIIEKRKLGEFSKTENKWIYRGIISLNGEKVLFKGNYHRWKEFPEGVVVDAEDAFGHDKVMLNNKQIKNIFNFSKIKTTDNGVIQEVGREWIFRGVEK